MAGIGQILFHSLMGTSRLTGSALLSLMWQASCTTTGVHSWASIYGTQSSVRISVGVQTAAVYMYMRLIGARMPQLVIAHAEPNYSLAGTSCWRCVDSAPCGPALCSAGSDSAWLERGAYDQFLSTDYNQLIQDANFNVIDAETQLPAHVLTGM